MDFFLIFFIVGQSAPVDPISGGAGWVGAGLLGLVLGWLLLVHLPGKDKQLKEMIKDKDDLINSIIEKKWQAIEKVTGSISSNLKSITDHCHDELTQICATFKYEIDRLFMFFRDEDEDDKKTK